MGLKLRMILHFKWPFLEKVCWLWFQDNLFPENFILFFFSHSYCLDLGKQHGFYLLCHSRQLIQKDVSEWETDFCPRCIFYVFHSFYYSICFFHNTFKEFCVCLLSLNFWRCREGNVIPLQYSRQENSMDRGAWWAIVQGVTKSQTQLNN